LKGRRPLYFAAHESPTTILYPLLFLGCGSIFFGYLTFTYYSYLPAILDQPIAGGDLNYYSTTAITNTVEGAHNVGIAPLRQVFNVVDQGPGASTTTYH
jgi:hypothetical protein